MAWAFSIGNLAQRAVRAPAAVSPAVGDTVLPLSKLASGYPDEEASFEWRSDGAYKVDVDTNVLASTSSRVDAPTGWRDLLLALAGTPGLPANPPDWGSYGSRTALRLYRPVMQEVEVMPGEDWKLEVGIYEPTASDATGIRVRVIDTWSGKGWNGTAWADGGVLDEQSTADAWKDIAEEITADATRPVRSIYRVVVEPIASSYGATTYVYASANGAGGSPALYAKADMVALIGHNFPVNATVSVGSESVTLVPVSCVKQFTGKFLQTWRLDIAMPTGNQPRPKIGELWIGSLRSLTRGPSPGITIAEGDPNQIRVEGAQGRVEILSDQRLPAQKLTLNVKTSSDAAYEQYRSVLTRGTRFGADPLLLIPVDVFDGTGRVILGRVGETISYTVSEVGWRAFSVELSESPLAAA